MAKIKLGKAHETFKKLITLPMLDGQKGTVEMEYIYRTRAEFSVFMDSAIAQVKAHEAEAIKRQSEAADEAAPSVTVAEVVKQSLDRNADHILHIAKGWDLDAEFNRDNVHQLCNEYPGAANAIMETYQSAIMSGRLGN